jgi:hypothetical protein
MTHGRTLDLIGRYQAQCAQTGLARRAGLAVLSANRAEAWRAAMPAQASGLAVTWLHPHGSAADRRSQTGSARAAAPLPECTPIVRCPDHPGRRQAETDPTGRQWPTHESPVSRTPSSIRR